MSCAASMGWDLSPVPWSVVNPSKSKCDGFELELPSGCSPGDTVHLAREQQLSLFPRCSVAAGGRPMVVPGYGQGEGCGAGQRDPDLPEQVTHTKRIMSCPRMQSNRKKKKPVISDSVKRAHPLHPVRE